MVTRVVTASVSSRPDGALDEGQAGDHLVGAAAELTEHADGVGRVAGLAQVAAVEDHLGVGPEDDRRAARPLARDGARLVQRDGGHGRRRRPRRMDLGDTARLAR